MATISWSNEQRRATAEGVLAALIANTTLTTTQAIAEGWATVAVSIANGLLNELAGTTITTSTADEIVAPLPPTTVVRADGLE